MPVDLPHPIATYFSADKGDGEALSRCFTDDAVVKDEGRTYLGRAAIKQWKAESSKKYVYTSEPFACAQDNDKVIVASRVSGNFPGSPVELRYFFGIEGNKIASLEIVL